MARPNLRLVSALTRVVERLRSGERFEWGHMGRCNCGFLAQELTTMSPADIHREALALARHTGVRDWTEHVIEHCPRTGFTFDHIVEQMLSAGMTRQDIGHLESLSDPVVLRRLSAQSDGEPVYLEKNRREDTILYLDTWIEILNEGLPESPKSATQAANV